MTVMTPSWAGRGAPRGEDVPPQTPCSPWLLLFHSRGLRTSLTRGQSQDSHPNPAPGTKKTVSQPLEGGTLGTTPQPWALSANTAKAGQDKAAVQGLGCRALPPWVPRLPLPSAAAGT